MFPIVFKFQAKKKIFLLVSKWVMEMCLIHLALIYQILSNLFKSKCFLYTRERERETEQGTKTLTTFLRKFREGKNSTTLFVVTFRHSIFPIDSNNEFFFFVPFSVPLSVSVVYKKCLLLSHCCNIPVKKRIQKKYLFYVMIY